MRRRAIAARRGWPRGAGDGRLCDGSFCTKADRRCARSTFYPAAAALPRATRRPSLIASMRQLGLEVEVKAVQRQAQTS